MSGEQEHFGPFPTDLSIITAVTLLTIGSNIIPTLSGTGLQTILGFLFVIFVPGYAVFAALFPERSEDHDDSNRTTDPESVKRSGTSGLERIALSIGLSLSVIPLVGFALTFTPWGIRLVPVLIALSAFTLSAVAIAAYRRAQLPVEQRFRPSIREWMHRFQIKSGENGSRREYLLNVLLVFSILLATSSIAFSVAFPRNEEHFTEFYLLSENENGTLVAQNFPSTITNGSTAKLHIGINNREGTSEEYIVIVELQRTVFRDNSTRVLAEQQLGKLTASVGMNESWVREFTFEPTLTGERLRLTFLLYRGQAPSDPDTENAYRVTHLWVNVTPRDSVQNSIMDGSTKDLKYQNSNPFLTESPERIKSHV